MGYSNAELKKFGYTIVPDIGCGAKVCNLKGETLLIAPTEEDAYDIVEETIKAGGSLENR